MLVRSRTREPVGDTPVADPDLRVRASGPGARLKAHTRASRPAAPCLEALRSTEAARTSGTALSERPIGRRGLGSRPFGVAGRDRGVQAGALGCAIERSRVG